ncbi:hypothetical protein Vadar_000468 [Vaccinium darrowii]|uniref:Uncharacterized protein n=1 Tax=Vaccinium darrowii TaxID=229202 RepID=A0ACB7XVN4_9ERIC|nr:hypothetical protein Vadar_000468 [Vaccinium darrowii]
MEAPAFNEVRRRKNNGEERENSVEREKEIPPNERENKNLSDDEGEKEIPGGEKANETPPDVEKGLIPPDDDICPICFGNYNVACKTDCGHWFCVNCVITYWAHGDKHQRCKCPFCSQGITKLTPEASLTLRTDDEAVVALKRLQGYNRLFEASVRGFILRKRHQLSGLPRAFYRQISWLLRMFYVGLWCHHNLLNNLIITKAISLLLTLFFWYYDFFLPGGFFVTQFIFQTFTVLPVILLAVNSLYRQIDVANRPDRLPGESQRELLLQNIELLMRTIYIGFWNPQNLFLNYVLAKNTALFLSTVYDYSDFNFIPGGFIGAQTLFELSIVFPVIILCGIGIYRKRRHPLRRPRPRQNPLPGP